MPPLGDLKRHGSLERLEHAPAMPAQPEVQTHRDDELNLDFKARMKNSAAKKNEESKKPDTPTLN